MLYERNVYVFTVSALALVGFFCILLFAIMKPHSGQNNRLLRKFVRIGLLILGVILMTGALLMLLLSFYVF